MHSMPIRSHPQSETDSGIDPAGLTFDYDFPEIHSGWLVVTVFGDLDDTNARQLESASRVSASRYPRVAIDLRGVELCDSDGLFTLLKISARAERIGQRIRLINLSGPLRRLLEFAEVSDLLLDHDRSDLEHARSPLPEPRKPESLVTSAVNVEHDEDIGMVRGSTT